MEKVRIKLQKQPGSLEDYGPGALRKLDALVGGKVKWNMSAYHGSAVIPGTEVTISRHETGPEIEAAISELPNIVSALAAVVSTWVAWRAYREQKNSQEASPKSPRTAGKSRRAHGSAAPSAAGDRKLVIEYKGHRYEGIPANRKQAEEVLQFFSKLQ